MKHQLATDWLRNPVVTYAMAVLMALATLYAVFSEGGEGSEARTALDRAKTFYEQNAEVDVSARNRQLLGPDFVDIVAAAYALEKDRGAGPIFSSRMQDRTQARFEAVADDAFEARMQDFAAWRRGVSDAATPAQNHLTHVFFHASGFALVTSLIFFVLSGIALEAVWGTAYFAGFCLLGSLLPGLAFRFFDGDGGVPLSGASGLVSAMLGALLVRAAFERKPFPGALLWPVWVLIELGLVRGVGLDHLGTVPVATIGVGLATGVICALAMRFLDLERQPDGVVAQTVAVAKHPALDVARAALEIHDTTTAWEALSAAYAESPADLEVSLALWELAVEIGRVPEATCAIAPILQDRLRRGATAEATSWWRLIVENGGEAELHPASLVKLGEALLDDGDPDVALGALQRALSKPKRIPTALAQRIVRIARDLDPALTHRAAAIALADPQLEPEVRVSLEALADEVRAAIPSEPAPVREPVARPTPPQPETTRDPIDSDIDLHSTADLTDPDEFIAENGSLGANRAGVPEVDDPNARSIASLERELAGDLGLDDGEELTAEDPHGWNDPGLRPELAEASAGEPAPALFDRAGLSPEYMDDSHLEAGALSVDALAGAGTGSGSETAPLVALGAPSVRTGGRDAAPTTLGKIDLVPTTPEAATAYPPLPPLGTRTLSSLEDPDPGVSDEPIAKPDRGPVSRPAAEASRPVDANDAGPSTPADRMAMAEADTAPIGLTGAPAAVTPPSAPGSVSARVTAPSPDPVDPGALVHEPAAAAPGFFGADELEIEEDVSPMRLRPLRLVVGVPIGAKPQALEVEVEGRGVSRVPFDRIEAVAVAAVAGLSEKPVLVIDLVLNWLADPEQPLKVVRIHSNRFDPMTLVPKASSPVDALRRIVSGILKQSGAAALPDARAVAGSPFSRFSNSADYEREVLGAEV